MHSKTLYMEAKTSLWWVYIWKKPANGGMTGKARLHKTHYQTETLWGWCIMDPIRVAYLAGFVDGEGCFSICRRHHKRADADFYTYEPHMVVVNRDRRPLEMFKETFGGNIHQTGGAVLQWRASHAVLKRVLEVMTPYLVTKKARAELMLEYFATVGNYGRNGYPPEIRERQRLLMERMQELTAEFNEGAARRVRERKRRTA